MNFIENSFLYSPRGFSCTIAANQVINGKYTDGSFGMNRNYYIWIEIQANRKTLVNTERFRKEMENCKKAGIGAVILSVKDTSGFAVYNSRIAPHYSEYDSTFKEKDYLLQCLDIVHELGMLFYA